MTHSNPPRRIRALSLILTALPGLVLIAAPAAAGEAGADKPEAKTITTPLPKPDKDGWIPLFNGKDLTGWTPKIRGYACGVNYGNTFRVENGVLKNVYDKDKYEKFNNRFGHLFFNHIFSRYRLRVEYRFVGEQCPGGAGWATRNNGIMVHGQTPQSMGKDQSFPNSIEVQLLGGLGKGKRSTGNLCTPGTNVVIDGKLITRHVINSNSDTYNGDQWVTVEVEVLGGEKITHFVNGKKVLTYDKPQLDAGEAKKLGKSDNPILTEGTISIQSESAPTEFRKIEIKLLDK